MNEAKFENYRQEIRAFSQDVLEYVTHREEYEIPGYCQSDATDRVIWDQFAGGV